MCDLSDGFLLCTCAGKNPDWVLKRHNPDLPDMSLEGLWNLPHFDEDDQLRILFIEEALSGGTCFDFVFTPREGDVFETTLAYKRLTFRYEQGRWTHQEISSFEPWASQLEEHGRGDLILPADAIPADLLEAGQRKPVKRGRQVLQDWILNEGHPHLARWLTSRLQGRESALEDKIGPKMRARLEAIFHV